MSEVLIDAPETERDAATKAAVLATAERLFAEQGLRAVSVSDITAEAGVNLASVNYHFGSKDALVFEIFRRRTAELSRERARRLHQAIDRHARAGAVGGLRIQPTPPSPSSRKDAQRLIRDPGDWTARLNREPRDRIKSPGSRVSASLRAE